MSDSSLSSVSCICYIDYRKRNWKENSISLTLPNVPGLQQMGTEKETKTEAKPKLLDYLAKYAVIGETIAIFVAIISIWIQWSQENELARAENVRALVEQAADFQYTIIGSGELTDIWFSFGKKPEMTPTQRFQYQSLLSQWLIIHESLYFQYQNGLFDESLYQSWDAELRLNLNRHDLSVLGTTLDKIFPTEYGRHLMEIQNGISKK